MIRRIAFLAAAPAALLVTYWIGCAPKQPVPNGPDHPADPAAAEAPAAPDPAPSADEHPAGGGGGHEHGAAGAGHDADEHSGQEHGGAGSGGDGADDEALIAAEMTAYQAAKPVFDEHCASCHTSSGGQSKAKKKALGHFTMDSYPFGGHHAGELGATIRKVLGSDGTKPTMPKDDPGAVKGHELELVVAWTRAYDDAARAGAGYHGQAKGHDHGGGEDHGGHHDHGHGD